MTSVAQVCGVYPLESWGTHTHLHHGPRVGTRALHTHDTHTPCGVPGTGLPARAARPGNTPCVGAEDSVSLPSQKQGADLHVCGAVPQPSPCLEVS